MIRKEGLRFNRQSVNLAFYGTLLIQVNYQFALAGYV